MEAPDFFVEGLLDFPIGDEIMSDAFFNPSAAGISADHSSSSAAAVDSCNSSSPSDFPSRSFSASQFSGDLCVPYEDVAELEWLSNFVEDSFSSEDLHKLHISAPGPSPIPAQPAILRPDGLVPGKARSKLARVAPSDWTTRLPVGPSTLLAGNGRKKPPARVRGECSEGEVRRCLHCASEKTPQWRTGPMGPKTLCNACGVRYKSGRLVPEYRPAASPTFVPTKHSNSHRKVVELRRQNEHQRHSHQHHHHHGQQFIAHGASAGAYVGGGGDYLIHHRVGPDFRQLI